MPKLSIVIPVYNSEKYLSKCIDSILSQTYIDFELILIDDGSIDRSGFICDEYGRKDQRIRVVHQKNAGVTCARKVGAEKANGDYVTYIDSDDWVDSDTYEKIMLNIEKHNADIGVFAIMLEKTPPRLLKNGIEDGVFSKEMLQKKVYPTMLFDYSAKQPGVLASLCNKVIKREILQKAIQAVPDYLEYGEDAISGYLCILNATTIYICNYPFYHYRDNPSSVSHANSDVMRKRLLSLDREMRKILSEYDLSISRQIDGHIALKTVELVRKDLLELKCLSFIKRRQDILDFCKQPQIARALKSAYPNVCYKKDKIKILLIKYRLFSLLYVFVARNK